MEVVVIAVVKVIGRNSSRIRNSGGGGSVIKIYCDNDVCDIRVVVVVVVVVVVAVVG